MALSISPAGGEASALLKPYAAAMVIGSAVMACVLLLMQGVARLLPGTALVLGASVATVIAAGWSLPLVGRRAVMVPQSHWQVPARWREQYPLMFTMVAFGFLLGFGVLTRVVVAAFWVLVALTVVWANALIAVIAWCAYGAVRAAMTTRMLAAMAGCDVPTVALPGNSGLPWVHRASGMCALTLAVLAAVYACGAV